MKIYPLFYLLITTQLIACQSNWEADSHLGSSVNMAILNQTVNPNAASQAPDLVKGLDGVSAKTSIESYQNSFIRRIPPVGNAQPNSGVFNGSSGSSSSGGFNSGVQQ